jgi:hypothetical protein
MAIVVVNQSQSVAGMRPNTHGEGQPGGITFLTSSNTSAASCILPVDVNPFAKPQ